MRDVALNNRILTCVAGSRGRGLSTKDSDIDRLGIFVEPKIAVMGLHPLEHYVEQTQPEGERASNDDESIVLHSLRKFARLAAKGNPSILELFFLPAEQITPEAEILRRNKHLFLSRQAGGHYLGYMQGQRQRLLGQRGQKKVKRPDLEEKYGYDVKYAAMIIVLGQQGIELMRDGKITVPFTQDQSKIIRAIRNGVIEMHSVLEMAEQLEEELKALRDTSPLPKNPDYDGIDKLLVKLHETFWINNDHE